jgi:hypothetical protein
MRAVAALALVIAAGACGAGAAPAPIENLPRGGAPAADGHFPNARVRLRVSQHLPSWRLRVDELELWITDTRFRVRDKGGRNPFELITAFHMRHHLAVPRGLGGIRAEGRDWDGATDYYGDVATGVGWFYPYRAPRIEKPAAELAGTELVTSNVAAPSRNQVTRVVDPPYVLFEDIHNLDVAEYHARREVLAITEGIVTDADVTPP